MFRAHVRFPVIRKTDFGWKSFRFALSCRLFLPLLPYAMQSEKGHRDCGFTRRYVLLGLKTLWYDGVWRRTTALCFIAVVTVRTALCFIAIVTVISLSAVQFSSVGSWESNIRVWIVHIALSLIGSCSTFSEQGAFRTKRICRIFHTFVLYFWLSYNKCILSLHFNGHFSRWTWVSRYQNVFILDFIGAKNDGGGGDNWSCKSSRILLHPSSVVCS